MTRISCGLRSFETNISLRVVFFIKLILLELHTLGGRSLRLSRFWRMASNSSLEGGKYPSGLIDGWWREKFVTWSTT